MGSLCCCLPLSGTASRKYETSLLEKPSAKKVGNWTNPQIDSSSSDDEEVAKTDREWKRCLSKEQYRICRLGEVEQAWVGQFVHTKDRGVYSCACCRTKLFSSGAKVESESGWPTFTEVIRAGLVEEGGGDSAPQTHVTVTCRKCKCHLGHVTAGGPGGRHYNVMSASLRFQAKDKDAGPAGGEALTAPTWEVAPSAYDSPPSTPRKTPSSTPTPTPQKGLLTPGRVRS